MNNWYDRISQPAVPQMQQSQGPVFQNPIQKAAYIMQALTNPAAFVKREFPDVPDGIVNDPVQIRNYLMQSRGISEQQLQQMINQYPMPRF
jgi:hypothetical protein